MIGQADAAAAAVGVGPALDAGHRRQITEVHPALAAVVVAGAAVDAAVGRAADLAAVALRVADTLDAGVGCGEPAAAVVP